MLSGGRRNCFPPVRRRDHMITDGNGFVVFRHYDTPVISLTTQGRNLQVLFRKVPRHEVEWFMEFDPAQMCKPEDAP